MTTDHQILIDGLRAAQASAGHAWASAMAAWVFGGAAVILNLVGFAFLWRQLRISQETAAVAQSAMELARLETRPWIKVEPAENAFIVFGSDLSTFHISIPLECTNIGKTPAVSVGMVMELVPDRPTDLAQRIQRLASSAHLNASTMFPEEVLFLRSAVGSEIMDPNQAVGVTVLCVVTYRAHANGPTMVTPLLLQENSLTWTSPTPGEHPVELINLLDGAIQPT